MEENRFMWSPKRYVVCTVCGCLIVAIAGAEIVFTRCHDEGCHEIDPHHHPVEFPTTNNSFPTLGTLAMATATTPHFSG